MLLPAVMFAAVVIIGLDRFGAQNHSILHVDMYGFDGLQVLGCERARLGLHQLLGLRMYFNGSGRVTMGEAILVCSLDGSQLDVLTVHEP
jgi:hypothetical protein